MMYYDTHEEALAALEVTGGFLLDMGDGVYLVTDDNPAEYRSFESNKEAMSYAFRLAEANFDETEMMPE
jgi:uncharacterized protein YrrD